MSNLDEDGYPTQESLDKIANWGYSDISGCFDFIRSIWWCPDLLWETLEIGEEDVERRTHNISTGGWSGNEDIIDAMRRNNMLWFMTWQQSRRGGHYIFEERGFVSVK